MVLLVTALRIEGHAGEDVVPRRRRHGEGGQDRTQRGGGGDHEYNDHLESCSLLDGGASENSSSHHAGDGYNAEDARKTYELHLLTKLYYVPHLIDVRGKCKAESVGGNGFASFESCSTKREISLDFIFVLAVEDV